MIKLCLFKWDLEYKVSLLICPVQLPNESDGVKKDNMISYVPKSSKRLLRPGILHSMHFKVTDMNDQKLYFNSGKIILICTIV